MVYRVPQTCALVLALALLTPVAATAQIAVSANDGKSALNDGKSQVRDPLVQDANLPGEHANRLADLDTGIQTFFSKLDPRFAGRTTILPFSEFGRRVQANQSNGTDHGTASALFAVGARVKGGLYGSMPSLTSLDRSGNLVPTVDFRSVYATVLDAWLGADSRQLLGARYENLGFLGQPG